jgi:uncharacterized protein
VEEPDGRGHNKRYPMAEDFLSDRDRHPLDDAYWAAKRPELEQIEVPALVCASWSDHGLHTRGSLEGFERIGSASKWLYTHGGRKWGTFYSAEVRELQRRFFDHFLKGEPNDWETTPRVRLALRRSLFQHEVRTAAQWPPAEVRYEPLFLDASTGALTQDPPGSEAVVRYDPGGGPADRASFVRRFDHEVVLVGGMTLRLWAETSEGDDMDVFVVLRKFDASGREINFYGYNGFAGDGLAKGWLRVSHRALDSQRSRPDRPWHTHLKSQPIHSGEVVQFEIEVLASGTIFEPGTSLRVDVLGHDAAKYPGFRHARTVNHGVHSIHTGGDQQSVVMAPCLQHES